MPTAAARKKAEYNALVEGGMSESEARGTVYPDEGITGPSSEPKKPVMTLGPVSAPVTRTVFQGIGAKEVLEGFQVWDIYHFNDAQFAWSMVVLTGLFSLGTNLLEKWRGRRVIGAVE